MEHERRISTSPVDDAIIKRRRLAEVEVDSTVNEQNCYYDEDNIVDQENFGEKNEQFRMQTEEKDTTHSNNNNKEEDEEADDNANKAQAEQIVVSEAMEGDLQQIHEKMERFTQQVSELLEAGKNFLAEISNEFEERIVMIHQEQMNKWEEEIEMLRRIDNINEDMRGRLHNAQYLLHAMHIDS